MVDFEAQGRLEIAKRGKPMYKLVLQVQVNIITKFKIYERFLKWTKNLVIAAGFEPATFSV